MSDYQLKIADVYNIPIGNVKKFVPDFFYIRKIWHSLWKLATLLNIRINAKKTLCIIIQSMSVAKAICWIQQTKKNRNEKHSDKDGKALYKLMNNVVYEKAMKNLRNRITIKLVSNKEDYLKWASKPSYMSHKIFDLVAIHKNQASLTFNKPTYTGMCSLELSKTLMYEFHYDYFNNKYGNNSRLLFIDTGSLMYEIET